tara:strand:- start:227 stop:952 length:726 start_codon:yes stop_codon:yes gene_type:complete
MQQIAVFGGTGLVGRAVCRACVQSGVEVTSLSRSGWSSGSTAAEEAWREQVVWGKADALDPASYRSALDSCSGVIFGIGALLEGNYKQWMGKSSAAETQTLAAVNRDSALSVARALAESGDGKKPFVFLSASTVVPALSAWSPEYIETKREAEALLQERAEEGGMRLTVLRPGLIFSEKDPLSLGAAALVQAMSPDAVEPPLHVDTVARAALGAALDSNCSGIYDVAAISALARGVRTPSS